MPQAQRKQKFLVPLFSKSGRFLSCYTFPMMRTAPHLERFAAMLDAAFRAHGAAGLPARFLAAVEESLKLIYSDRVLAHVAAGGEALPSTNSQPSFVLWLVYLLDVRPGQNILEIRSGSGWLAGILAHLAGPSGQVTGTGNIAPLAAQSRVDLA